MKNKKNLKDQKKTDPVLFYCSAEKREIEREKQSKREKERESENENERERGRKGERRNH